MVRRRSATACGAIGRMTARGAKRTLVGGPSSSRDGLVMGKLARVRRNYRCSGGRCRGKCCQHENDVHVPQHEWSKRRNQSFSSIFVPAFLLGIQPGTAESDNWKPVRKKKFSGKVAEGCPQDRSRVNGCPRVGRHSRENHVQGPVFGVQWRANALSNPVCDLCECRVLSCREKLQPDLPGNCRRGETKARPHAESSWRGRHE